MSEEREFLYDDDDAVKFIRNYLPQELNEKFSDDDLVYIVDMVCDFYESQEIINGDDDDVVEIDEEEVVQWVLKNVGQDGVVRFTADEVALIVQGELCYCESLDMFE